MNVTELVTEPALVALVAVVALVALPLNAPLNVVAVTIPAIKFPEPSRETIAFGVLALVALEVTVNVVLPDWFAVNDAVPDNPVPETPKLKVPLPTDAEVI